MAPEVALSEAYHLSADIYSFSIVLWELLTLSKAFGHMSPEEHREKVVKKDERPPIDRRWSPQLVALLEKCWARNPFKRPEARDVHRGMQQEVERFYDEDFLVGE